MRSFTVVVSFYPSLVFSCPRCLEATPYKTGLVWATFFLLAAPFTLVALLTTWIIRASK